jgi:branched-chain amino acid transport system substrate-binding protein
MIEATRLTRRGALLGASSAGLAALRPSRAAAQKRPVRIGVCNDQSGAYSGLAGPGSVVAARLAISDFGGEVLGRPIELLVADHQNKPDVGSAIARRWFDSDNVTMIIGIAHSAVALAVQQIARTKNKVAIYTAVGTTEITEGACSPTGFSWCYDAYALSVGLARSVLKRGLDTWYLIVVDYTFGRTLADEAARAVAAGGGAVLGSIRYPENVGDFSSYLLQAQASKAKVVALMNSGNDMVTAMKQAQEFGLTRGGHVVVAPLVFVTDIHAMGLNTAQGLNFLTAFYWDRNQGSRDFARRFFAQHKAMPTMAQAAAYSGVSHYLRSMAKAGTDNTDAVVAVMRKDPVDDFYADKAMLRADGRLMHAMYLVQVKTPEESKKPWDYYNILTTVPADQAFKSLAESRCPLKG